LAGVERERPIPGAVERRVGEAPAEALRARPRHARGTRGARDAAGFEKRGEEDALPGRRPVCAERRGGGRFGSAFCSIVEDVLTSLDNRLETPKFAAPGG